MPPADLDPGRLPWYSGYVTINSTTTTTSSSSSSSLVSLRIPYAGILGSLHSAPGIYFANSTNFPGYTYLGTWSLSPIEAVPPKTTFTIPFPSGCQHGEPSRNISYPAAVVTRHFASKLGRLDVVPVRADGPLNTTVVLGVEIAGSVWEYPKRWTEVGGTRMRLRACWRTGGWCRRGGTGSWRGRSRCLGMRPRKPSGIWCGWMSLSCGTAQVHRSGTKFQFPFLLCTIIEHRGPPGIYIHSENLQVCTPCYYCVVVGIKIKIKKKTRYNYQRSLLTKMNTPGKKWQCESSSPMAHSTPVTLQATRCLLTLADRGLHISPSPEQDTYQKC